MWPLADLWLQLCGWGSLRGKSPGAQPHAAGAGSHRPHGPGHRPETGQWSAPQWVSSARKQHGTSALMRRFSLLCTLHLLLLGQRLLTNRKTSELFSQALTTLVLEMTNDCHLTYIMYVNVDMGGALCTGELHRALQFPNCEFPHTSQICL